MNVILVIQMRFSKKNDSLIFAKRYKETHLPKNIDEIVHRDNEIDNIVYKLLPLMDGHTSSPFAIIGLAGSGKKTVLHFVLEDLQKSAEHDIIVLPVPCIDYSTPAPFFRYLINKMEDHLDKKIKCPSRSVPELISKFAELCTLHKNPIIIIFHEIEYLKDTSIFRYLNRLPESHNIENIQLIISTHKVSSKDSEIDNILRSNHIVFPSYTTKELIDILSLFAEKYIQPKVIEDNVIKMCAAYISSNDGSAHHAISLLNTAGRTAVFKNRSTITEEDIQYALSLSGTINMKQIINSLPTQQVYLLLSSCLAEKISSPYSAKELGFSSPTTSFINKIYKKISEPFNYKPVSPRRVSSLLSELELSGFIQSKTVNSDTPGLRKEISLKIPEDQLFSSLEMNPEIEFSITDIEKILPTLQPIVQERLDYIISLKKRDE